MTNKKSVLILGVGAQGSTVAKRLMRCGSVATLVCADRDAAAATRLADQLTATAASGAARVTGVGVDAADFAAVSALAVAHRVDVLVNGLPIDPPLGETALRAAVAAKADYVDFAAPDFAGRAFEAGVADMLTGKWSEGFAANGRIGLTGCGSTPGLTNVVAREVAERFASVEQIEIWVYEYLKTNRVTPFWWSPKVALDDYASTAYAFEDGALVETEPFSRPVKAQLRGVTGEVRLVEHAHEEPVT
eukprot:Selendium_serpulae@DN6316_c1_g2_i1.p1